MKDINWSLVVKIIVPIIGLLAYSKKNSIKIKQKSKNGSNNISNNDIINERNINNNKK